MLDQFKRQAFHLDLHLVSSPNESPLIFFHQFVDELVKYIDSGDAAYIYDKHSKAIRARGCHYDIKKQILHLLINYTDTNLSDPAFENLATGKVRISKKQSGEGIAVSTHMSIDLKEKNAGEPVYQAFLEDVPGVGRTKLIPFMTALVRDAGIRILWNDPAGSSRKSRPLFDLKGSLSETLKNDLDNGKLSMIELSKYHVKSKFDQKGRAVEDRRTVVLKVAKHPKDQALDIINSVRKQAKNDGYTDMKVTYRRDTAKQVSKKFGTAREDVSDVLTIKVSEVALKDVRLQCEEKLRDDVVQKMTKLIEDSR